MAQQASDNPKSPVSFGSANVTIAEFNVSPDDHFAKFLNEQITDRDPSDFIADYLIRNYYVGDKHVYMSSLTVADEDSESSTLDGDTVAFCQIANASLIWVCEWTACKVGSKPQIPSVDPDDPNFILLDEHYEVPEAPLIANGFDQIWRISGTFWFGHRKPSSNLMKHVRWPLPPWVRDDGENRTGNDVIRAKNIIEKQGAGPTRGDAGDDGGSITLP